MYARCARRTHASFSSQRLAFQAQKTSATSSLRWTCRRCLETAAGPSSAPPPAANAVTPTDGPASTEAYEPSEMVDWLFSAPPGAQPLSLSTKPQLKSRLEPEPPLRAAPAPEAVPVEQELETVEVHASLGGKEAVVESLVDQTVHAPDPAPPLEQVLPGDGTGVSSVIVRLLDAGTKKMVDFLSIVREMEKRFGRVRDFRIQKDQEANDAYLKTVFINFENSSSVDKIREGGIKSLHLTVPDSPVFPLPSILNNGTPLSEVKRYLTRQAFQAESSALPSVACVCECDIRIADFPLNTSFPRNDLSKKQQALMHQKFIEWGGFYPHEFVTEGPIRLKNGDSTSISSSGSADTSTRESRIVREAKEEMELALNASRFELYKIGHPASGITKKDGQLVFKKTEPEPEPMPVTESLGQAGETSSSAAETVKRTQVAAEAMTEGQSMRVGDASHASVEALASSKTAESVLPPEPEYIEPLSAKEREDFRRLFRSMSESTPQASEIGSPEENVHERVELRTSSMPSEAASEDGRARRDDLEASMAEAEGLNRRERRAQRRSTQQTSPKSSTFTKRLLGWMGR